MNRSDLEAHMRIALEEANAALLENEVPVGAAVFQGERLLAQDHNRSTQLNDMTAHAELLCLRQAARENGGRLDGCTLYVTLEPCTMCFGAAMNVRLDCIVFGAYDSVAGACVSCCNLNGIGLNKADIIGGILSAECEKLLSDFFSGKRCKTDETNV